MGRHFGGNMKVYFVRHGQSLGNAERVLLGHCDLDLSPLGVQQAKLTAEAMKDFPIDIIYSSDLLRAYNTAKPHADLRGISVIPDKCFRECYLGDWEGKPSAWCGLRLLRVSVPRILSLWLSVLTLRPLVGL